MKAQDFIAIIAPMAQSEQRRTGVLASITIAQGAIESGWGTAAPGNNLFGIKGSGQLQATQEFINDQWINTVAGFRVYSSWEGSVIDHSQFLVENGRYARAGFFNCCSQLDYVGAARCLQNAGYATDPNYAAKLVQIIQSNNLDRFDILETKEEPKIEEDEDMKPLVYDADWKWDQLAKSLDGLYHAGLLENYNWAEQASKREINAADALLIIATMLARQNGVKL
ncbi:glycoside hydrolase family 73 protein [Paenibacillus periandrae]|uniref:glycoside hydrolase family 73 protein n=1 Tax=Paenibacillus periandrae TaxID=1761741 RepID=UPI001F09F1BA|nr:glycoside hydrolase family 73 protein [Paenibacillus periandrae]